MRQTSGPNQDSRRLMMLNDPIPRIIPKMALPTIVAFLITTIYSLADTYFVSSLGTNATAAVSVNASLDQMIMMCGSMLAMAQTLILPAFWARGMRRRPARFSPPPSSRLLPWVRCC